MTLTPGDDLNETRRQRTRDQLALVRTPDSTAVIVDTDDPADFTFACHSQRVLVNSEEDVVRLRNYFERRVNDPDDVVFTELTGAGDRDSEQPSETRFVRYVVPQRTGAVEGDRGLLTTLDEMDLDELLEADIARPDHLVHICGGGRPSFCPATEPTETDQDPWPTHADIAMAGDGTGVEVVVLDTGWYDPTQQENPPAQQFPWSWIQHVADGQPERDSIRDVHGHLRPYAGHGTFVVGVIQSIAPGCTIRVLSLPPDPDLLVGGAFESEIVNQLDEALTLNPDLINLSAGCPTRQNKPARGFENWWADVSTREPPIKLPLIVAAAGNNSSPWGFWPASFDWALGVGSVDRDGRVSDFSNWGDSVDVFALGRNLVNAFPNGTYVCHESPDRGDKREFKRWRARWSGTSFSAPLVTGMIAAEMSSPQNPTALAARATVLAAPRQGPALRARTVPVVRDELLVAWPPPAQS